MRKKMELFTGIRLFSVDCKMLCTTIDVPENCTVRIISEFTQIAQTSNLYNGILGIS